MNTKPPPTPLHHALSTLVAEYAAKARDCDSGGRWMAQHDFVEAAYATCYKFRLGPKDHAAAIKAYEREMRK